MCVKYKKSVGSCSSRFKLRVIKFRVETTGGEKLAMCSLLDDVAIADDENSVGIFDS